MKRILILMVGLLVLIAGGTTYGAFHYRSLYLNNPRLKTVEKNSVTTIRETNFDPGRSQAYRCAPHKVTAEGFGMVCANQDGNIQVKCTVAPSSPNEYFC